MLSIRVLYLSISTAPFSKNGVQNALGCFSTNLPNIPLICYRFRIHKKRCHIPKTTESYKIVMFCKIRTATVFRNSDMIYGRNIMNEKSGRFLLMGFRTPADTLPEDERSRSYGITQGRTD